MSIADQRQALVQSLVDSVISRLQNNLLWDIDEEYEREDDLRRCVFDVLRNATAAPIDAGENVRYRFVVAGQLHKSVESVLVRYLIWQHVADVADKDDDDFDNNWSIRF